MSGDLAHPVKTVTLTACRLGLALCLAPLLTFAADPTAPPDNGTDPTKVNASAGTAAEHLGLRGGFAQDTLKCYYATPVALGERTSLRLQLPLARNDVAGKHGFGLGDLSLKLTKVYTVTKAYGIVFSGELSFDTAARPELGAGQTVCKPTFVYAKFLAGGDIFAPAVVQSIGVGGRGTRARVNSTVFDFYYVPRSTIPKLFMTLDPALSIDWEGKREFVSLAVTLGRSLGPAFGGNAQVYIKPTIFAGGERPANWGIEVGYKVIGF